MRYLIFTIATLFALPASAQEFNDLLTELCNETVLSCDADRASSLSHGAINKRIERATAVGMATDFHRADEDQDNHLILNISNFEFDGDATALGIGYIRDFTGTGWSAGAAFATDVNSKDQAIKATVGYSW